MRARGGLLAAAAACAAVASPALADPLDLPPTFGPGGCFDPSKPVEPYGPTDVNVQVGNGRVTVNENEAGTITVFKYPNPSLYNLVKYFTLDRNARGRVRVQYPNEGSFAGIRYSTASGVTQFAWLRDWRSSQRYDSPDTPVSVTTHRSPRRLGLRVTSIDLVPPGSDHLLREFWVNRSRDSPVRAASLVYFANFNPIATHIPFLPITDWCTADGSDQHAAYDAGAHAIVNWWSGIDLATGMPSAIAVAFGFAGPDTAHQVGEDAYDPSLPSAGPPDAYVQASSPPHRLGGDGAADGQTTGALEQRLRFDDRGRAEARMTIAAGSGPEAALAALNAGRRFGFARQMAAVRGDWRRYLRRTRLPAGGGRRVIEVAKRSLMTVRLARAAETGAIVASVNTQSPYGEDWIRDGAFINRLLDMNGFADWVTQHNLFYARVQTSGENPSALRPPGNWAMNFYFDGVDGGPIPWEIDETGFGIWTLFDHYRFLRGEDARSYLTQVYPAIARAADFLVLCEDPTSGLQCIANEDDHPMPSQTLHGAGPVFLGLRSAIAAAEAVGDRSARVAGWQRRLERLRTAIDALYDPDRNSYALGKPFGNVYRVYEYGGWLLWPVRFRPYGDRRMVGEAAAVNAAMRRSLASPRGAYEAKALLGLSHAWKPFSRPHRVALERTLRYLARALTTATGLFGEAWTRVTSGRPIAVQDQPHVWQHTLFYLAALQIEGSRPYRFQRGGFYARACARGRAPRSACR